MQRREEKPSYEVLGSKGCKWTTKLLESIKKSPHADEFSFVNCDLDRERCAGVSAYPSVRRAGEGEMCLRGFAPADEVIQVCRPNQQSSD